MKSPSVMRRWLAAVITVAAFAVIIVSCGQSSSQKNFAVVPEGGPNAAPAAAAASSDKPLTSLTKGGGWTLFGGTVHRNFVNPLETNVLTEWNVESGKEKNVKWAVDLGSLAYGGPIIADGKIFIGTNNENPRDKKVTGDKGILMCFRESDGKFLWQAVHDKLPGGQVSDWPKEGICSSPVVEGKRLYYVCNRCELICADTEGFHDGKNDGVQDEKYKTEEDADIIWRFDMIKELHVFPHNLAVCSPLIVGDLIYVVTSNGVDEGHKNVPEPGAPSFVAINKKTGKLVWQKSYPGEHIMHGQWSNPTYAEVMGKPQIIFPGGDGWLYAVDPTNGDIIWKFDGNPKNTKYVLGGKGTKNDYIATPVVHDNKLYIGVGQDPEHDEGVGHLWCIDLVKANENAKKNKDHDVSPELTVEPGPSSNEPAKKWKENPDSALLWHYGGVTPKDSEREETFLFGRTLSTCAVHDGLVYAAEQTGYLHCLDAKTGKQYWEHNLDGKTWASPYWVDGKIFMGNDKGKILIFTHGKEKKDPIEINMGSKYVRATPVVSSGVMYVMTEAPTRLYAIQKKD